MRIVSGAGAACGSGSRSAGHHQPAVGHHRQGGAERLDGVGVELSRAAHVVVELTEAGIHHPVEHRPHRLVLEHILLAVQVGRAGDVARFDLFGEGVE